MHIERVEKAIRAIASGEMVILVDDKNRENEGDLVAAAQNVSADTINFMAHYGCGLICMPMTEATFERLNIPMMVPNNQAKFNTAFGVSIGSANGITTGISAADRAHTMRVAANPESTPEDIVKPGHVFPLKARPGGVLERRGQTEGSIDLVKLAGLHPAAAICEIMNDDGTMAREKAITQFAKQHDLVTISVQDLVDYRMHTEILVTKAAQADLPTHFGPMSVSVYHSDLDEKEWVAVTSGDYQSQEAPLVRLHSACLTGDVLHSLRCDCGEQLQSAQQLIAQEGGVLLYLPQEGRGIGLTNKIKAYALQDASGLDTVEANERMGFLADERDYGVSAQILKAMSLKKIRVITNNPKKIAGLERHGIQVVERIHQPSTRHDTNSHYLDTKKEKLGHWMES